MGPEDRGEVRVGPQTSYDDELAAMKEQYDRDNFQRRTGIVVPRSVR
jgi:hypothetical protein